MGMTDEQKNIFKKIIYDPYSEAWFLMKELRDSDLDTDKAWEDYVDKIDAFGKKHTTEIGQSIYRILLDTGTEVRRIMNEKYSFK